MIIFFSPLGGLATYGQELYKDNPKPFVLRTIVIGQDTIPLYTLHEFNLSNDKVHDAQYYKRWSKLRRYVVKVYPYAKTAADLMQGYSDELDSITNKRRRKKYMKDVEAELKEEFSEELKNLTINQGKILIKLIDRETGHTSFEIIKEMRGTMSAFFWQSLSRIFGSNLKSEYDPEGEDLMIEEIVQMIERGEIVVEKRAYSKKKKLGNEKKKGEA